jgi:hypothetical protein
MAAPNATQSPFGVVNKAVADTDKSRVYDTKYATYLKLFSGELFKAYEAASRMARAFSSSSLAV